ncbi:MAG: hypothetical protein U1F49_13445 [Rubrivivax sp.]
MDLDGGNLTLLSSEAADHTVEGAPWPLLARLYGILFRRRPFAGRQRLHRHVVHGIAAERVGAAVGAGRCHPSGT